MQYTPRVPVSPPMAGAVELLFALEAYSPQHRYERVVPNGRITLVIELDGREREVLDPDTRKRVQTCSRAWISGTHRRHIVIGDVGPDTRLVAVQFAVGAAHPFLHASLHDLNDRVAPATEVLGESILELRELLLAEENPERRLDRVEAFLVERHDPERARPAVVSAALEALTAGEAIPHLTRIVEERHGVSYKHFLDLFKRHVGPTPKVLQRILRFIQIFERVQGEERVDWAGVAIELGYSDQAHLIREFKAFSGYRPQRFLEDGHERLNFFPDDRPAG